MLHICVIIHRLLKARTTEQRACVTRTVDFAQLGQCSFETHERTKKTDKCPGRHTYQYLIANDEIRLMIFAHVSARVLPLGYILRIFYLFFYFLKAFSVTL